VGDSNSNTGLAKPASIIIAKGPLFPDPDLLSGVTPEKKPITTLAKPVQCRFGACHKRW